MNEIWRCKSCKANPPIGARDDAEKPDPEYPDHCRGCAVRFHEEIEYREHLDAGGKPFTYNPPILVDPLSGELFTYTA